MRTAIHDKVERARNGTNPQVICKAPSGWIILGDAQFLRGYSLLLPDPVVPHLNAMTLEARALFLQDMTLLGDAVLAVTGGIRINYEMLGNVEPALHAHVFPRFDDEPEALRKSPVWFYDWKTTPQFDLERDRELMQAIAKEFHLKRSNVRI